MKYSDFTIGCDFKCNGRIWRCTDIGTRVIVAIAVDYADITTLVPGQKPTITRKSLTDADFNGPPYSLVETVFDEYDIEACQTLD